MVYSQPCAESTLCRCNPVSVCHTTQSRAANMATINSPFFTSSMTRRGGSFQSSETNFRVYLINIIPEIDVHSLDADIQSLKSSQLAK